MIPKIIHYCWFGGSELPSLEKKCIESWKNLLPDYEFMLWNESNFDMTKFKFAEQAFKFKKYAFVADVCRLFVLKEFGGIYLDTDVLVLKNFNQFLNSNNVIFGMENERILSTACILSPKNNFLIESLLVEYESRIFEENGKLNLITNTEIITQYICNSYNVSLNRHSKIELEGLSIFPQEYFSPKVFGSKKSYKSDKTFCIHLFNSSWLTRAEKIKLIFLYSDIIPNSVKKIIINLYNKVK